MRLIQIAFAAAVLVQTAVPGLSRAEVYVVDKSHAFVTFTADHLGFSAVHGQFRDFDADIELDPSNVEATRVRFVVRTASVDTYNKTRDNQLRSAAFFDSENFPEMVFTSTEVRPTGADTAEITGDLNLIGVARPITLEAKLNQFGPSPLFPDITVAGFTVTGVIDRTEFGMTFGAPAIGAEIPIRIDIEMSPAE
ncbi:MAG: YceI family protein [Paracoccaceae bacterium]|nr:YceI family protein [Paracoccaceae bacterium]